jgi:hypothetical protein
MERLTRAGMAKPKFRLEREEEFEMGSFGKIMN